METTLLYPGNKEQNTHWEGLHGSSLSLLLSEYCQQTAGIKLLITEDPLQASGLKEELKFFLPEAPILYFPDWETLPYDQFSPHQDLISERLYTLNRIGQLNNVIVIASVSTLMHYLPPPEFLNQYAFVLNKGQPLNLEAFRTQLDQSGYRVVNKVLEHGEFSLRGGLIDVFPMGSQFPFRIELFDEEIDSLRTFDPDTQRTIAQIDQIHLLPAREFPLNEQSQLLFRRAFRERFSVNPSHCPIYEAISNGQYPPGIEYYLPLFFEKTVSFFEYLPKDAKICLIEHIPDKADAFWQELSDRYEQRCHDLLRPILDPKTCFIQPDELLRQINTFEQRRLFHQEASKKSALRFHVGQAPSLPIERKNEEPLARLRSYCEDKSRRYLIVVESAGRREVLLDLLKLSNLSPKTQTSWQEFIADEAELNITIGPLQDGFELTDKQLAVIVETQLFGEQSTPQGRSSQKTIDPDLIIRDLAELRLGAPVVHINFGVGRYQGLQYLNANDTFNEFLVISYADDDKIYVPVTSLHLISRYTGVDSDKAPLHKLGSEEWQRAKKKSAEKIFDVATQLLELYAKREAQPGYAYDIDQVEYNRFASAFPFTETVDQTHAIEQILYDLRATKPMDRLICGDVGFGKTEVAMRAAFIAVQDGKQVCVLVPTTLLAAQHFDSFKNRFADFPVRIELLSRFRSAKESEQILAASKLGQIDILIGTHKLFHATDAFKNLGLLIIDEEHRFGVKQKERLKTIRNHVDILSLTATPIPRTLNMAMSGIRDISLITTPPAKRLAIKTFWQEKNNASIREAILREILRGGQVFFLHNKVQTIANITEEIEALVPEAKVRFAHGQMRERELERIMSDFYHHRFNVLVCTTIIETGIDIPTANTMIIEHADQFGLAQLHQLRGRVGRSHHQAYAYLFTAHKDYLTADAIKRLNALVSLEDLGAGFTLATHDLEIRGAGELLGEEQSGNMHAIGFNLFMEMLDRAVKDLKAGKTPELNTPMHQGPEIDLGISAIIPEDYIADIHDRLIIYKRIANAETQQALDALQVELIDRFGLLPQSVKYLFRITALKLIAATLGIKKITANTEQGRLEFLENASIDPVQLIKLIQVHSASYQMQGPQRLRFKLEGANVDERLSEILSLLHALK